MNLVSFLVRNEIRFLVITKEYVQTRMAVMLQLEAKCRHGSG